jgi:nitroimidazol reductase NimA-like FMN-containing flavoprotein (pyridoxamine 5'-phosphate oxidase superfamily)
MFAKVCLQNFVWGCCVEPAAAAGRAARGVGDHGPVTTDQTAPLSPTERSTPRRETERTQQDRAMLYDVLETALICHLAVVVDGVPKALPTVFGVDLDGPDDGGTLYVHGSVASRSLRSSPDAEISVTMTMLDGLVLARSGFMHSMNYRSAVVIGRARLVEDAEERAHALDLVVDHVVPGRAAELRRPTRKELAATAVIALPLHEASVKMRAGDPEDEDFDVEAGVWAGVVPLRLLADQVVTSADAEGPVPEHVTARATGLAGRDGDHPAG